MTGWGQTGPWSSMAGHDIDYIALTGALLIIIGPVEPMMDRIYIGRTFCVVVLAEHSNHQPLDVLRILKMVLIHDLVEIDAGDTFAYDAAAMQGQHERESVAAEPGDVEDGGLGAAGRRLVVERYSGGSLAAALEQHYGRLVRRP